MLSILNDDVKDYNADADDNDCSDVLTRAFSGACIYCVLCLSDVTYLPALEADAIENIMVFVFVAI